MGDVKVDAEVFKTRVSAIVAAWKGAKDDPDLSPLGTLGSILLVAGNSDEANPYRKTGALQTFLLGYEFPSTLTLLTPKSITFVCSEGKAKLLQPLAGKAGKNVDVVVKVKTKDAAQSKEIFEEVATSIEEAGGQVGTLPKDKYAGKFVDEWTKFLADSGRGSLLSDALDAGPGLSAILAIKDSEELSNTKVAAQMSVKLMQVFCDQMMSTIENEKKTTHEKIAEQVEAKLEDNAIWSKAKFEADFDSSYSDWCYSPIVQSGGDYDLRTSAASDDQRLRDRGIILASLGIRYKSYCANVGRTFMVDPDKSQEANYKYLLGLQAFAVNLFKEGETVKDVHAQIVEKVSSEKPELEGHLPKNFGFGIGLEFRDSAFNIGPKCSRKIKSNMTFSLALSFADLEDPTDKKKTYALQIIDTVVAGANGGKLLSDGLKSTPDMTFFFRDSGDRKPAKAAQNGKDSGAKKGQATMVAPRKGRLRNDGKEVDSEAQNRRKEHQRELAERRQEEGLARFAEDDGSGKANEAKQWKRFESYQREKDLPSAVAKRKIYVDITKRTFILPIHGYAVPFHINTLKNVVKLEEGEYTTLRFMFVAPGQITGKKEDTPFEDPNATFIRVLTFRNTDHEHMSEVHKQINDLKKAVLKREKDKAEMADVVDQDDLREVKRPIKMLDISLRPMFEGKRQAGDVEIHSNGIRYQSSLKSDQRVDILFSNIKHLFFQPCDQELIVILHIHLKAPILVGKKKTRDVQFYREASEAAFDETGNRKRRRQYGDDDEIEAEQDERRKRAELNRHFKAFADKIAEASDGRLEVDIPYRELGFQGVPSRSNVLMQPTTDCLVHLVEPPFLVITLAEVEVAHLERVQYGLKNFDLVFVLKDFKQNPITVNTIPTGQLENVKEWLDSCDIPFTEGPVNLNWGAIMKTVNDDPYEFFKEGGWSFLGAHDGSDSSEEESDEDESAFEMSSDAGGASSESESYSEDASASDYSGSGSEEESESGADWSDMERKAAKSDAKKKEGKAAKAPAKGKSNGRRKDDSDSDVSIDSEEEDRKARKRKGKK